MTTDDLLLLANAYAEERNLKISTVSSYAANDGKFFDRLSEGAGCTLKTATRLLIWFSENWPAELEWPASIARPSKKKDAA